MEIKRITWKSSSGMCDLDDAYNDKFSVTETAVYYSYEPYEPTPENREINWMYASDSLTFRDLFRKVAENAKDIGSVFQTMVVTDVGEWNLEVLYEDGHVETADFTYADETLVSYLEPLKGFVPTLEKMPRLFEISPEDFMDAQEEN